MRDFLTLDTSGYPIVVAKYHDFVPSFEEFIKSQDDLEAFYKTHTHFVLLVDFGVMPYLPVEYRMLQAKWGFRCKPLVMKNAISVVFYAPSKMLQLFLKMFLVAGARGCPTAVVSSLEKGYEAAKKMLEKNGTVERTR